MDGESIFKFYVDSYYCITIDSSSIPKGEVEFGNAMQSSLAKWKKEGYTAVWLKLPVSLSHLIPVAVDLGFEYHHAKKEHLCLSIWLKDSPNKLPDYASTSLGVGGFVYDEKTDEVLVVKEKNGPMTDAWKLPGGLVDHSEDIYKAAVREVFEETGVKAKFDSLLYFKVAHHNQFDASMIYFVALLTPETKEIKIQEDEIADAKWIKFDGIEKRDDLSITFRHIISVVKPSIQNKKSGFVYKKEKIHNHNITYYYNKL